MPKEPFVPAEQAAEHVGISRRLLLAMARKGIAGACAVGTGDFRKRWVFRLSELEAAITGGDPEETASLPPKIPVRSVTGSPR